MASPLGWLIFRLYHHRNPHRREVMEWWGVWSRCYHLLRRCPEDSPYRARLQALWEELNP